MDTGHGLFKELVIPDSEDVKAAFDAVVRGAESEYPNHGGTFYVGQNLEFNGSKFRVLAITKKTMTLKLLSKEK